MRQLTFTRFMAAMSVVVFHWSLHTPTLKSAIADYQLLLGPTMVSYFFVLSGFIMATVYFRPDSRPIAWEYWRKRVARIYPVYILGVIWMAGLLHAGIGDTRHDWKALLLSALMLQAWVPQFALSVNAPGWSLSAEAFFYFAFPAVLALMTRLRSSLKIAIAIALFWVLSQAVFLWALLRLYSNIPVVGHEFLHYNPLLHLNTFLVGLGAGLVLSLKRASPVVRAFESVPLLSVAALGIVFSLVVALILNLNQINAFFGLPFSPTNGLLAPLFALFIAILAVGRSGLSELMATKPLVLLGEISYGIYILHIPVAWSVRSLIGDRFASLHPVLMFGIYVVVLISVAMASYRFLESPVRNWARARAGEARVGAVGA